MNRHLKSFITLLLFVLLLVGIYIVPIRQGEAADSGSGQPNTIQHVSVGK